MVRFAASVVVLSVVLATFVTYTQRDANPSSGTFSFATPSTLEEWLRNKLKLTANTQDDGFPNGCEQTPDYFQALKLDPSRGKSLSDKDVKKAFRRMSISYMPDKHPEPRDAYERVAKAYEFLKDENRRLEYAQCLEHKHGAT